MLILRYLKKMALQFGLTLFWLFLTTMTHGPLLRREMDPPFRLESFAFTLALAYSLGYYILGMILSGAILNNGDGLLLPFTPLTLDRLHRRGLRHNVGKFLAVGGCLPAIQLLFAYGLSSPVKLGFHRLAPVNLSLACALLMLLPLHLYTSPAAWLGRVLFPTPLLLRAAWGALLALSARLKRLGWVPFVCLIGLIVMYPYPLCQAWNALPPLAIGQGLPGAVALFLFAPVSCIFQLGSPEVPDAWQWTVMAILGAGILICLLSWIRALFVRRIPLDALDTESWMEHREVVEEIMDQHAALEEVRPDPWRERARGELAGRAPEPATMAASIASAPIALADEAPAPAPASLESAREALEYRIDLQSVDQVVRCVRAWSAPQSPLVLLNPWLCALPLLVLPALLAGGWLPKAAQDFLQKPRALVYAFQVIVLLIQASQISSRMGMITTWAVILPLRWPQAVARVIFSKSRQAWAFDMLLILTLYIGLGCHAAALLALPIVFLVNWLTLCVLCWISAMASAGRRMGRLVFGSVYVLIWVIALFCALAAFESADADRLAYLAPFLWATALMILLHVPMGMLILWRRLWADFQIMAPSDYRMFVISQSSGK